MTNPDPHSSRFVTQEIPMTPAIADAARQLQTIRDSLVASNKAKLDQHEQILDLASVISVASGPGVVAHIRSVAAKGDDLALVEAALAAVKAPA